jgi:hypothetical protein
MKPCVQTPVTQKNFFQRDPKRDPNGKKLKKLKKQSTHQHLHGKKAIGILLSVFHKRETEIIVLNALL